MLVSESHEFMFVHVPRTGGSSARRVLEPCSTRPSRRRLNKLGSHLGVVPWRRRYFAVHTTLAEAQSAIPREIYQRLFKFAIVRNPWDRLVSQYYYVRNNPAHHRHRLIRSLRGFEEYVDYEIKRNKFTQLPIIVDRSGNIGLDFIGRFERLDRDVAHAFDHLGLESDLPHINESHKDVNSWRAAYTRKIRERVAGHWAEEIERLEYSFDD